MYENLINNREINFENLTNNKNKNKNNNNNNNTPYNNKNIQLENLLSTRVPPFSWDLIGYLFGITKKNYTQINRDKLKEQREIFI